jgi:hypothetical protein
LKTLFEDCVVHLKSPCRRRDCGCELQDGEDAFEEIYGMVRLGDLKLSFQSSISTP